MAVTCCRLCKNELNHSPILSLAPFPKAAQYYPEPDDFENDKGIELAVFQCSFCELVQLKIDPVAYYKEVITAASLSPKAKTARLLEIKEFTKRYNLIGKSAIEIGCGKGDMLDVLQEANLRATGIEFSENSVQGAIALNRNVICHYLNIFEPEDKFDVFFSFNYLEHQPDVKSFIAAVERITTPEAMGYITVPNLNYLLESNCLYEFVADHLVYFTEKTFRRAFEMNGFDVLTINNINNGNDILAIVKKRKQLDLTDDVSDVEQLTVELNTLVDSYVTKNKKIAVWGAGHRSLALMAMSKLDKITYIVDSADFKQGKYSPVIFNKIVSPATFEHSDVDAIIVMVPGIYPQEVLATIRTYQRKIDVFILEGNNLVKAKL